MDIRPSWTIAIEEELLNRAAAQASCWARANNFRCDWFELNFPAGRLGIEHLNFSPGGYYLQVADRLAGPNPCAALRVLNRITTSPKAAEVWTSFERFGIPPFDFFARLCAKADWYLARFSRVAITTKDRKRAGARIRTLALKLAEELSNPAVAESLRDAYRKAGLRGLPAIHSENCLSLAIAASEIGSLPKAIPQPNDPDAHRLYFIRGMTNHVNKVMGTPMRSQVFALASVFFDMGSLTPDQLATLAPVRKRAREVATS